MAGLDIRTFIRAPPERVWQIISDLPAQAKWMVDVRHLEIVGDARAGPGTVIKLTSDVLKLPVVHDTMTIEAWSPPYRYDVSHVFDLGRLGNVQGSGAFILEPAPGGTVFTWQEELRPPLGPVGELGWKFVLKSHLTRQFARSMDNVRKMAESLEGE
jgi:uncharacterized protein YndB with AHSA1/START domain